MPVRAWKRHPASPSSIAAAYLQLPTCRYEKSSVYSRAGSQQMTETVACTALNFCMQSSEACGSICRATSSKLALPGSARHTIRGPSFPIIFFCPIFHRYADKASVVDPSTRSFISSTLLVHGLQLGSTTWRASPKGVVAIPGGLTGRAVCPPPIAAAAYVPRTIVQIQSRALAGLVEFQAQLIF